MDVSVQTLIKKRLIIKTKCLVHPIEGVEYDGPSVLLEEKHARELHKKATDISVMKTAGCSSVNSEKMRV